MHNPYSLTNKFDVIYLDQPVGTGFSTGRLDGGIDETALDVVAFLRGFLSHFPTRFQGREVYVLGEQFRRSHQPTCELADSNAKRPPGC